MATDISVSVDAYQHLDNTYDPSSLGKVIISVKEPCRDSNPYIIFDLPTEENNFAITLDDLKRAIRALEDQ
jgi:hypothetical protein